MGSYQDANSTSSFDNTIVEIKGGTDQTTIGNVSDRLKVDVGTTIVTVDPKTFIVSASDITIGNNKSMISLLNASGSSVVVRIHDIKIINAKTTAVTGVVASFSLLRFTGHSGGTSLSPQAFDTIDSLNISVTARTGGTITGEAATPLRIIKWSSDEWGVGALDVESNDHTSQELIPMYEKKQGLKAITLRAGEGVHIKQTVNSTAGSFTSIVTFSEESS